MDCFREGDAPLPQISSCYLRVKWVFNILLLEDHAHYLWILVYVSGNFHLKCFGTCYICFIYEFSNCCRDGSLPVSFIKKYLVKKLNLASEAEVSATLTFSRVVEISFWTDLLPIIMQVEISLQGQPLLPTLQLHNLINWWVQTGSTSERIQTFVGGSAKDFVMVLSYGRKA